MSLSRSEVPASRKWRTEDIFATLDDWNKCYDSLTDKLDFSMYEGKLYNADTLIECYEKLNADVQKIRGHPRLHLHRPPLPCRRPRDEALRRDLVH